MNDELTLLRQIVAISRTGSFTLAAKELHLTQPALSRNIATFEARYGIRLFDRGRAGAVPTAVGASVIADASALLRTARGFRHNLELYRNGEAGKIAIGIGPILASLFLPHLSKSLMRQRPKLQFSAVIKSADQLATLLMDDAIELIFGSSRQLDNMRDVSIEKLGILNLAIVVRSGHPLADRKGLCVDDLLPFPVASAVPLPGGGLTGDNGSFICDNFHILRETVLATDCVWSASPGFIKDDLASGQLVTLDVTNLRPARTPIRMVHRVGRKLSPAALAVVQEVKSILLAIDGKQPIGRLPD